MTLNRTCNSIRFLLSLTLLCATAALSAQEISSAIRYQGPESLRNSRVVVGTGTSHAHFMHTNYPTAKVYSVDNLADIAMFVERGNADFGVTDIAVATAAIKANPSLIIVDSAIFFNQVAMGLNKKSVALHGRINDFLKEIEQNGVKAEMDRRWHESAEPVVPKLNILKRGKTLVAGVNSDSFPFVYIYNNEFVGYDIELLARFAERENLSLEISDMSFLALISSLASGRIDVAACCLSVTEERKKQFLFSDSYYNTPSVVLASDPNKRKKGFVTPAVTPSDPERGATKADTLRAIVGGRKVAVVEGTVQDLYISDLLPMSQISIAKEYPDAFLMLQTDNAAFTLCNLAIGTAYMRKDSSLEVSLSDIIPTDCCFGINKNNEKLRSELNAFISELDKDGALEPIKERWLSEMDEGQMPELTFKEDGPVLRVGSTCTVTPFTFIANGEHRGADIEILNRFAAASGRRIEVLEMPFSSLVAALVTNKIDIIANMLSPTEERKKAIDFTLPYNSIGSVLLGVKQNSVASASGGSWFSSIKESFTNNLIVEKRYMLVLSGLKETLILSLFSLLLGTIIGAFVCYLRMSKSMLCSSFARAYITVMRGMPVLVLLMINYYVVFANTPINASTVAVISFAMNFGAYVSEMFRSSITSIDKGQTEAGIAMGFTPLRTFLLIVAPQAIARVLPVYKGEAISLIKMTSIVGYIAVQDLTKVSDIIRSRTFDAFFPLVLVAVVYFLLALGFAKLLDVLTSKIIRK